MTILSVIQDVCTVVGLDKPDAALSSTVREHVELVALAQEMADRIARSYDWQVLSRINTITGDGATTDYDLPSDYDRMPVKANLWSSSLNTSLTPISQLDEWLELTVQAFTAVTNAWIIYGGQIHFMPALADTITAKHFYQSNLIVAPDSGANKTGFTVDTDSFRLDAQLLKLAMIWQWRANKGYPYDEDMASFEELKDRLIVRDKGSHMLRVGRIRMPADASIAYGQRACGPRWSNHR
jgi:hypothetical protein